MGSYPAAPPEGVGLNSTRNTRSDFAGPTALTASLGRVLRRGDAFEKDLAQPVAGCMRDVSQSGSADQRISGSADQRDFVISLSPV
jgi:hypothetical protein